jgi:multimeric flavodoxin WrbA
MKKIFALVGSRSVRRTTYHFVENIILEINKITEVEHEILTMSDINIKPCTGCGSCFKTGFCWQKDDLSLLQEKMLEADLFIIAAPVYMHGMPGEMKNIIDRLATWAHTLRLAGKNIIIASTCDSNGHTTVVDDLHLKMLHMGGRVIGKFVGANYVPEGLVTDSDIMLLEDARTEIPLRVSKTIENWEKEITSNKFNESLFSAYRENHLMLLDLERGTGETDFWVKSGMIQCTTYQEYLDLLYKKGAEIHA